VLGFRVLTRSRARPILRGVGSHDPRTRLRGPGDYRTSENLVIFDVGLIDGTGAPLRPRTAVVVSGGRVREVASAADLVQPEASRLVDGRGKFLIPGLWDSHVHAFCSGDWPDAMLPAFVAHGIVGVRDMHGDVALARGARAEIDRGTRVGPRLLAPGLLMDGAPPFLPGTTVVTTPEEGRLAVRRRAQEGADFVKVYSRLGRAAYKAILDEAREAGLAVAGHVPLAVSALDASVMGQATFEHLMGLEIAASTAEDYHRRQQMAEAPRVPLDGPNVVATFSERKASALGETLARNRTAQVPTLVAWRALAAHPLEGAREVVAADPRSPSLPWSVRHTWTVTPPERIAPSAASARALVPLYERLVFELRRSGVPILAGTDTPNPFVFPGSSLHDELELLVNAGLTEMEALQAATAHPARQFGLSSSHGTIEAGKVADMVLLGGNPLEDIRCTRLIDAVVLGGTWLDRAALSAVAEGGRAAARRAAGGPAWSEILIAGRGR